MSYRWLCFGGSLGVAYVCDTIVSDKKIFGGEFHLAKGTCRFVSELFLPLENRHHLQDCDGQGVAGHRGQVPGLSSHCWTAGHHERMNPISPQNFIIKDLTGGVAGSTSYFHHGAKVVF
jgi:hypothetical protein